MSDPQVLHGGCLCGKVRYAITAAPDTPAGGPVSSLCNFICHCGNCKKASGTHMANTSMFRRDQFSLTLGAPAAYEDGNNDSENVLLRWFCRDCGSPLYITSPTTDSSFVTVASGTLDDGSGWWRPNTGKSNIHVAHHGTSSFLLLVSSSS